MIKISPIKKIKKSIFFNDFNAKSFSLLLIVFAFIATNAIGFCESIIVTIGHVDFKIPYQISYALDIWLPRIIYPLMAICVLAQCSLKKPIIDRYFFVSMGGVALIFILLIRQGTITPAIFASAFFVAWIAQWSAPHKNESPNCIEKIIVNFLLIYLISPLILLCVFYFLNEINFFPEFLGFIIDNNNNNGLFRGESFRGFARDRIGYSYLCGIVVLYLLSRKNINFKNICILAILLICLVLSGSRAVLIALVLAACSSFPLRKMAYLSFVAGLLIFLAAAIFSDRPDFFGDPGNRLDFLLSYWNYLLSNPLIFLFGEGGFGSEIFFGDGVAIRAHSWPVNSIMNFGILTTFAWVVFLYTFFRKLHSGGRAIVIYFVTVGLFHNGFDAYFFSMEQLMGFLMALTLGASPLFFCCYPPQERHVDATKNLEQT